MGWWPGWRPLTDEGPEHGAAADGRSMYYSQTSEGNSVQDGGADGPDGPGFLVECIINASPPEWKSPVTTGCYKSHCRGMTGEDPPAYEAAYPEH